MSHGPIKLVSLNVGKPERFFYQGKEILTGMFKQPAAETLFLSAVNLTGDGQADLVHHGGPERRSVYTLMSIMHTGRNA